MNSVASEIQRLKHVVAIKGGAGFPHDEQDLVDEELPFYKVAALEGATAVGVLGLPDHRISRETAKRLGAHIFAPNTVVFAKVGAALLLNRFRQLGVEACIDNNMMGLEALSKQIAPRFLMYAMAAKDMSVIVNPGAVPSINGSQIAEERIWCPPRATQERIANFLDEKTARIDALIAEKERLHQSLEEWYAAEMMRLCLGQDRPVVKTGNSWVPELPKGWRLMRLKHLVTGIEQGWSPECEARLAEENEWGVLKAGAANGGVYRELEHKALPANLEPLTTLEVKKGDVLITRASGTADFVGSFAYVYATRIKLMLSDKNFRLRFSANPLLAPELLAWACNTRALREQVLQFVSGSEGLAKNIGSGSLRELWLPVPPMKEQTAIVDLLRARREQITGLRRHLTGHIDRLREYRSSLISAAVTGQLDLGKMPNAETVAAISAARSGETTSISLRDF